ncbi:FMRFamide receptor-like [Plakobranchus ocellatus]|uniref:FMRFamide receptor-like n=1 Tax=Plakobranchus ocellatus TaxID=259542 RepID=A0AAV4AEW7_9GAST|nr:FMRFamide receptor-like [Plakobranchus ocellatus]
MELNNTTGLSNETWSSLEEEPAYQATMFLLKVVVPVLTFVGVAANVMVLIVLRRGAIQTDNLRFFLSILAVVDTVYLLSSGGRIWIRFTWDVEILHLGGTWSCAIGLFLIHLCTTLSAWLVVIVAWQRWYTLSRPFQRCCPVESASCGRLGLVGLVVVMVAINSYVFITVELKEFGTRKQCVSKTQYKDFVRKIVPYMMVVSYSLLPALLLLLMNCLLARVLYISRRSLVKSQDSTRSSGDCTDTENVRARYSHVTMMLLVLSASWLVLTMPHTVYRLNRMISKTSPSTTKEEAESGLLNTATYLPLYINHSINFFLYCALIKGFRREVRALGSTIACFCLSLLRPCRSRCCRGRRSKSATSSTSSGHCGPIRNNSQQLQQRAVGNVKMDSFAPLLCRHGPGGDRPHQHGQR